MSIEIRPNAVTAQTNDKFKELSSMLSTIESVRAALNGFANSGATLSGAGYDAARSHMAQYDRLLNTLEASVRAVRDADTKVRAELGVFGCDRVSEREWKDSKTRALRRARMFRAQANALAQSAPPTAAGLECEMMALAKSEQAARHNADHAGHMLSLIYSYCEKTNGLYEGAVEQIGKMAAAGVSRFANCRFSVANGVGVWEPVDESLWFDQDVYDSCAYVMKKKGFGEVCDLAFASPTVTAIERWWDENNWWIDSLSDTVLGFVGIAEGFALLPTGIFAPLGLYCIAVSSLDIGYGVTSLVVGEKHDWRSDLATTISSSCGTDPSQTEFVTRVLTGVSPVALARAPINGVKMLKSGYGLSALKKEIDVAISKGFSGIDTVKALNAASTELRKELLERAIDTGLDIKEAADFLNLLEKMGDSQKSEGGNHGESALASAGYGG